MKCAGFVENGDEYTQNNLLQALFCMSIKVVVNFKEEILTKVGLLKSYILTSDSCFGFTPGRTLRKQN